MREFCRQNKHINSLIFPNDTVNCTIQLFNKEKEGVSQTIKSPANPEIWFISDDGT